MMKLLCIVLFLTAVVYGASPSGFLIRGTLSRTLPSGVTSKHYSLGSAFQIDTTDPTIQAKLDAVVDQPVEISILPVR